MKAVSLALFLTLPVSFFGQSFSGQSISAGIDQNAIDKTADPCQNFYQYACGNWMKTNAIPPDESSWGRFDVLQEQNETILRAILEDSEKHQQQSPIDQKIGGFYQSCMNETLIERQGTTPLRSELERISHIGNASDLLDEVARLQRRQVGVFFSFNATPDPTNATRNIADLDQGGLGLPERDFYIRTDAKSDEIRRQYVQHIGKMFQLLGDAQADAERKAASVMAIETGLAKASLDITSRRNPQLLVHEMPKADLETLSPGFDFNKFFLTANTPEFSTLNVAVPDFVKALSGLLTHDSLDDLKTYLAWQYVHASARLLPKAFVEENFAFYGHTLSGTTEMRPRWKRCVAAADDELGEALGRKFVEKTFGEQGKQRTLQMVNEIERQMANDIQSLMWMSPETKQQALVKLHTVANKIGYPDKWRDYSTVNITDSDYFGNWYRANEFEAKREWSKIGKPVDRAEWGMTPPTVNAYYNPTENNINFPAGILQPPFYSNAADDAVNYGAIGMVIGHELTHGFDDEGRKFDADGNLKDWWQPSDNEKYDKLSNCFVKQYGGFTPVEGVHLNGKLTLGENTADNGGIRLAYSALLDDLAHKNVPVTKKTAGYTQAQQFFLGFAQVWCENQRPEEERLRAQTDPHSPGKFRVDGVISNTPEFSTAFGCKVGDSMYAARGCRVW